MRSRLVRRSALCSLALAALLWCGTSRAEEDAEDPDQPRGWEFGLRTGYGLPGGKVAAGSADLSEAVDGMIPIWVDAGYRIIPHLYVGAYFQYGFLLLSSDCDNCSGQSVRLGADVIGHILPRGNVDPWLGAGFGYEWLGQSISSTTGPARTLSATFHGWEALNLQAGVDFKVSDKGTVGPFIAYTISTATNVRVSDGNNSSSRSDFATAAHNWLILGARISFIP